MGYIIRSREHFYVDGKKSTELGLNVEFLQPPAMAVQQYTSWDTGKDMGFSTPDDFFENIQYDIEAKVLRSPDAFGSVDIYAAFAKAQTLTLSVVQGYYYKIRRVLGIAPSADPVYRKNEIIYTISLELAPFKYHIDNTPIVLSGTSITNPGTRYSRPKYVISNRASGNTQLTLYVNGRNFELKNLTDAMGSITIDAEKMLVYDTNGNSLISKSTGQIPFLAPDVNAISVSTGTLTITGNWRSY